MLLDLGADFEQNVLKLGGLDKLNIDPGSVTIDHLNFVGDTTIRATVVVNVPTPGLTDLILQATQLAKAGDGETPKLPADVIKI